MAWRRLTGRLHRIIRDVLWWVTISPYCVGSKLSLLGAPGSRSLHLGGDPDQYPVTELLGRLWIFRNRLRFARSLLILPRALVLCGVILLVAKALQVVSVHPMSSWLPLVLFLVIGWGFHLALHHEIPSFEIARLLDRRVGLQAQLATAVEYTLARRLDEPLVKTQVRLATTRIRELEPSDVVPVVWPTGELRMLALVGVLYGAVSVVGSLGLTLPRPPGALDAELAKLSSQDAQAPSSYVTIDGMQTQLQSTFPTTAQVPPQLKILQQELASQSITQQEYQAQLQQLQKQLQQQASQSFAAQQALNALAAALKDSSTTHSISDSLARGDYQQAASQLDNLSQQLDKLSPEARSELASRLGQAASQTQQLDKNISQNAQSASDALKQGDATQASQSIQSLSKAVQQASSQIAAQSQLGQDLQQVQRGLNNQPSSSNPSNSQSGQSQDSIATSGASQQQQTGDSGAAQGSLDRPSDANSGSGSQQSGLSNTPGQPTADQQIQQDPSKNAGGAGSGPGSNALDSKPTPLDVSGVKVTITGQASVTGNDQTSAGDRSSPLTGADGSAISGVGGASSAPSNVPINVHQESNVVPLEMKPVVREYFSNAGS
jgi:hypothetical protein